MSKTLTLSKPMVGRSLFNFARSVIWYLLDESGKGFYISWVEYVTDTHGPECMAFACEYDERGNCRTNWSEQAVSYNPDAALALRDVMKQLKEKHGYTYNTEVEVQLLPGEVVADDDR